MTWKHILCALEWDTLNEPIPSGRGCCLNRFLPLFPSRVKGFLNRQSPVCRVSFPAIRKRRYLYVCWDTYSHRCTQLPLRPTFCIWGQGTEGNKWDVQLYGLAPYISTCGYDDADSGKDMDTGLVSRIAGRNGIQDLRF